MWGVVPYENATGISYRAELGIGLQIPWGAPQGSASLWKGLPQSTGDGFAEGGCHLPVLGMPVSVFLVSNQEKGKIAVKLWPCSSQPRNAQGVSRQHHFLVWEKETHSPAAETRYSPRKGRFVSLRRKIFYCGGGCGAAFPDSCQTNSYLVEKNVS